MLVHRLFTYVKLCLGTRLINSVDTVTANQEALWDSAMDHMEKKLVEPHKLQHLSRSLLILSQRMAERAQDIRDERRHAMESALRNQKMNDALDSI